MLVCLEQGGLSLTWTAVPGAVDYVVKVYQQDTTPVTTGTAQDAVRSRLLCGCHILNVQPLQCRPDRCAL